MTLLSIVEHLQKACALKDLKGLRLCPQNLHQNEHCDRRCRKKVPNINPAKEAINLTYSDSEEQNITPLQNTEANSVYWV